MWILLKFSFGALIQGNTLATPVSPAISWTMLVTHITGINKQITEPHDSACFGPVSLTFFCVLDENVDDYQSTETCEVNVCQNCFKNEWNVAQWEDETGHMICVDDREIDVPYFLIPFLY